jgi:hypothetical protein
MSQCIFCGSFGVEVQEIDSARFAVVCENCQASGPVRVSAADALDVWENPIRRQPQRQAAGRRARAECPCLKEAAAGERPASAPPARCTARPRPFINPSIVQGPIAK